MRYFWYVVLAALLLLCGCSAGSDENENPAGGSSVPYELIVGSFSFEEDNALFADETAGIKREGFVNTEAAPVEYAEQAIELAKKECTVMYDNITVDYDGAAQIYRVNFYLTGYLGGDQTVYIDSNGRTVLIVYGE